MSTFVKQADVRQEQFDWGDDRLALPVREHGLEAPRRHGRHARAGRGATTSTAIPARRR